MSSTIVQSKNVVRKTRRNVSGNAIDLKALAIAVKVKRGARSLRDAAEECGIPHDTLQRVERERTPTLETFTKICSWLGMEMDYFRVEQ